MNNVLVSHYSTMLLAYYYTIQFSFIKHNVSARCISAFRQFILILGPWPYYKGVWCLYMDESCGELRAPVPGKRLRDIALIGELLILQGIWVPDVSINASRCILLRNHKNDIGGQQVIHKSCVLKPC